VTNALHSIGEGESVDPKDALDVLLADYDSLRDDERSTIAFLGVAISVGTALLGGLVAFAGQSCTLSTSHSNCTSTPTVFLAAAPAVPFIVFGFVMLQGIISVVRSYYIRMMEFEIQTRVPIHFKKFPQLGPASYIGLTTEILSLRRGRRPYRLMASLILFIVGCTFAGITIEIAIHVSMATRIMMICFYGAGSALVVYECYVLMIRGRRIFYEAAGDYRLHKQQLFTPVAARPLGQRNILSYLLIPRFETLPKSVIPIIMFCAAASVTHSWHWGRFLLLWIVLEYLIYTARYQWNDLRDFETDQRHPSQAARRRLPAGYDAADTAYHLVLTSVIIVLRIAIAVFIGYITHTTIQIGLIIGAVFGVAIFYELLRARVSGDEKIGQRSSKIHAVLVWLAVGPGYAIRGAVGLLAAHCSWDSSAFYLGLAALTSIGIMVALLSWLLDVSSYFLVKSDGGWQLKDNHSLKKQHLILLLRYAPVSFSLTAPVNGSASALGGAAGTEAKQERFLISGSVAWAPWNIAFAAASVLAAEFAISLPGGWRMPISPAGTVAAVSIIGIVLMIYSRKQRQRWAVVAGCAALMGLSALWVHIPHWPLVEATWLAISITYVSFHRLSFVDLIEAIPKLWRTLIDAASSLLEVLVGPSTFRHIKGNSGPRNVSGNVAGKSGTTLS
jgi:hypothetical protein